MNQRRVFIAISLPEKERKKLINYQDTRLLTDCFRHTRNEDLHLTLVFIGDVFDEQLALICDVLKEISKDFKSIPIKLKHISYGPNPKSPRLVWIEGLNNDQLTKLRDSIEEALIDKKINYQKENRQFKPHITLARLNRQFDDPLPEAKDIETDLEINFEAQDIKFMESELTRLGAQYTVLGQYP